MPFPLKRFPSNWRIDRVFVLVVFALVLSVGEQAFAEEKPATTLYNGIQLPAQWPPKSAEWSGQPMPLPYLDSKPAVAPIDVGRQLFIDDFLIEKTNLRRTFHSAQYIAENPILVPDKPWEQSGVNPMAMVFSDGVWFDPKDRIFKMWYMGGEEKSTCYATSPDGIHWDKPALDAVKAGTNMVRKVSRDSNTVWLDQYEKDPARRFKMFTVEKKWAINLFFSPDGIHWGDPVAVTNPIGDRSTIFYNPFRNVWVFGVRGDSKTLGRIRLYWESSDVIEGSKYSKTDPTPWVGADTLDPMREDLKTRPQLYNLDAAAYESIMLGQFTIWRGQPNDRAKPNEVLIGFSRDGYHWDRTNRTAFLPVSEHHGDWNWCNVQSCAGGPLVVGDKLYFYCSGRAGVPGSKNSGRSVTSLATLRRDGFASMDTPSIPTDAAFAGELVTRPVKFSGKHLFLNADAVGGEIRTEIQDQSGQPIAPFSFENSTAIATDATRMPVSWKGAEDLSKIAGKPVRFRFRLTATKKPVSLYAFWVSPEKNGASHGYVGAGGPGFEGPTDTVGDRQR